MRRAADLLVTFLSHGLLASLLAHAAWSQTPGNDGASAGPSTGRETAQGPNSQANIAEATSRVDFAYQYAPVSKYEIASIQERYVWFGGSTPNATTALNVKLEGQIDGQFNYGNINYRFRVSEDTRGWQELLGQGGGVGGGGGGGTSGPVALEKAFQVQHAKPFRIYSGVFVQVHTESRSDARAGLRVWTRMRLVPAAGGSVVRLFAAYPATGAIENLGGATLTTRTAYCGLAAAGDIAATSQSDMFLAFGGGWPSGYGLFFVAGRRLDVPIRDGMLIAAPDVLFPFIMAGDGSFSFRIPAGVVPPKLDAYVQVVASDLWPNLLTLSNALRVRG